MKNDTGQRERFIVDMLMVFMVVVVVSFFIGSALVL